MLDYLRKIGPLTFWTMRVLALAGLIVGIVSWLSGSFVPFASAVDFWGRLAIGAVVVVATGILCGIVGDLEDRFDDWRHRRKSKG